MRILIVDEDRPLAQLLARALASEDAEVDLTHRAGEALAAFRLRGADLILLDLDLELDLDLGPDLAPAPGAGPAARPGGLGLLEALRQLSPLCPVLVLSASAETSARVRCLDHGADDCLCKPFSLSEVRARVRALLRRQRHLQAAISASGAHAVRDAVLLAAGGLTLHRLTRAVELGGVPLALTTREFTLLEQLLLAGGAVVARARLREALGSPAGEANTVDVHMVTLRRKLAVSAAAPRIETIRGSGYRLVAEPIAPLELPRTRQPGPHGQGGSGWRGTGWKGN